MTKPPPANEHVLYQPIADWLRRRSGHNCHITPDFSKGKSGVRPDVTGIKHVGGPVRGDFELIAVEVKKSKTSFVKSVGQTSAYKLFADRSYLACYMGKRESYSEEDIETAGHLGIGLISVTSSASTYTPKLVLSAPLSAPIPRRRHELLEHLGLAVCQLCEVAFPVSGDPKQLLTGGLRGVVNADQANVAHAATKAWDEGGYMFFNRHWTRQMARINRGGWFESRRYLCPDCVENLFAHARDFSADIQDLKEIAEANNA